MRSLLILLIPVSVLLSSCTTGEYQRTVRFPIKIGLLADSQITSCNGFSDFSQRSKTADTLVDVAIRPPALERYLSPEMLRIALDKLTKDTSGSREGVDVILYLGDGANSGGADEMQAVLNALNKCRQETNTPIFMVIGNHDYLGCGNITTPGTRFALLNRIGKPDNPPLTKYEVLKKISEFNNANNQMPTNKYFRYLDNIQTVEKHKELDHRTGLYLAGRCCYNRPGWESVEIFLMDSSDYKDSPDWSETANLGFYGAIGSVSFKDDSDGMGVSQLGFFKKLARTSSPNFRLIASHYPKTHLDRLSFTKPGEVPLNLTDTLWEVTEGAFTITTFSESLNANLNKLLLANKQNYWLSAHTHVSKMPSPQKVIVGGVLGEKYFSAINVGSTTDYRAHVAIVEGFENYVDTRIDGLIGYREIPVYNSNEELLTTIPKAIAEYGRNHYDDPDFSCLMVSTKKAVESNTNVNWLEAGVTLLGLDKKYQESCWGEKQSDAAERHVSAFVDEFMKSSTAEKDDVVAFLGLLAGAYEKEKLPKKCDFNYQCLKELCAGM